MRSAARFPARAPRAGPGNMEPWFPDVLTRTSPGAAPDAAPDLVWRAESLRDAGDLDEAEELLASVLELHPGDPRPRAALARVRADRGDAEGAEEHWRAVLALDPANLDALRALAARAESAGRRDEAMELFRRLIRLENAGFDLGPAAPAPPAASTPAPAVLTAPGPRVSAAPEPEPPAFAADVAGDEARWAEEADAGGDFDFVFLDVDPLAPAEPAPPAGPAEAAGSADPLVPAGPAAELSDIQVAEVVASAPLHAAEPVAAAEPPASPPPAEKDDGKHGRGARLAAARAALADSKERGRRGRRGRDRRRETEPAATDESAPEGGRVATIAAAAAVAAVAGGAAAAALTRPHESGAEDEPPAPPADESAAGGERGARRSWLDRLEQSIGTIAVPGAAPKDEAAKDTAGFDGGAPAAGEPAAGAEEDASATGPSVIDPLAEVEEEPAAAADPIAGESAAPGEELAPPPAAREDAREELVRAEADEAEGNGGRAEAASTGNAAVDEVAGSGRAEVDVAAGADPGPARAPSSAAGDAVAFDAAGAFDAGVGGETETQDMVGAGASAANGPSPAEAPRPALESAAPLAAAFDGALDAVGLAQALVRALERDGAVLRARSSVRRLLAVALGRELGMEGARLDDLALAAVLADADGFPGGTGVTGVALPAAAAQALALRTRPWNGPGGGEPLSLAARVLAVAAAAADALTTPGARANALAEVERGAGTAFDPAVVGALRGLFARPERHGFGHGLGGRVRLAHGGGARALELSLRLNDAGYEAETVSPAEPPRAGAIALVLDPASALAMGDALRELRAGPAGAALAVLVVDADEAETRALLLAAGVDAALPSTAPFAEAAATLSALLRRSALLGA